MAVIILLIYGWTTFIGGNPSLSSLFYVSHVTAGLAAAVAVLSAGLYFWTPKKLIIVLSAIVYGLLVLTTGLLVIQSGGVNSPFIALWMAVSVFAGLYGIYGIGAVFTLINIYIVYGFIGGGITKDDLIVAVIAGELPMFISYILWNGRESLEEARHHDVTHLNKTIEKESTKSDMIIESIGDGVVVISQTGEILLINPAAQKMTGWSAADATNLHFGSVIKFQDEKGALIENELNPISRALNISQQVRVNDICLITKSGKKLFASFVVNPVGDAGEGVIAVFRDITKERNDEKAQAEFISTASHEMRTPVASIEGYLGLALNPNTATIDEKARDFITKAHASAQHLGHLFQDLLDISKADDGRLKENPVVIDAVDFMRNVVDGLRPKASEKNLTIIYKPDGTGAAKNNVVAPILYAHVDKEHLREVADNLVENAIKYTLEGSVSIDVTASDDYVRISIKDSGIGIPTEDIPHLFQKFYRVDNTDTREIGGTGLGLYLCRKLVESMEGRIWVESEYKKGSTFFIEIPRIDRNQASELLRRETQVNTQAQEEQAAKSVIDTTASMLGTVEQPVVIPTPPEPQQTVVADETTIAAALSQQAPVPVLETPTVEAVAPSPVVEATPATPQPKPIAVTPPEPQRFGAVAYGTPQAPSTPEIPTPAQPESSPTVPTETPNRANTPLAALESNPERYIAQRPR